MPVSCLASVHDYRAWLHCQYKHQNCSENERARLCVGEQLTYARLALLDMLPFRRLFCLSLSKFWGLLAALVVDDLLSDACGFFHCMYMYV